MRSDRAMKRLAFEYQIGAYYCPIFHADPRNEERHGPGWTEWELIKAARPRFPGHRQPRIPLWGYQDESDPKVFARKSKVAAKYGITAFIFDWYWYNDGPFLQRALENGFLRTKDSPRPKFALMWANHDWIDIHPAALGESPRVLYPGAIGKRTFDTLTDYVVQKYFSHPAYWTINGAPYFSVYELDTLIRGLGGVESAARALDAFRRKTRSAGFPGLHLNAVLQEAEILPGETHVHNTADVPIALGFDSMTSYVWLHHCRLRNFPCVSYDILAAEAEQYWYQTRERHTLPYHPNVTMGWDASPRARASDSFENKGYPFMPVVVNNTPAEFKKALIKARTFLDNSSDAPKLVTINAWNEWTEGSYLEPDTVHGLEYLQAVKDVFRPSAGQIDLRSCGMRQ
jgi:hypothetical protein